ncbi:TPA: DUF1642 domain-containing protein [Streptococcus suis]|nr:DUF1642 domain-containing protein [Streptococcus suis]HEP1829403.1 DUF1642 domain-containing protein [Streptococcus suis]
MKQNDFYEVNGCTEFIPVTINETYADGVDVTVHSTTHSFRMAVKQVYQFLKQHEPERVVVPKFISDWIGECKGRGCPLRAAMKHINLPNKVNEWFLEIGQDGLTYPNQDTFARAWLDGYEIEQEQLYTVELFNGQPLVEVNNILYFSSDLAASNAHVGKDKLEAAGFGWVFDCSGVKVVEVE